MTRSSIALSRVKSRDSMDDGLIPGSLGAGAGGVSRAHKHHFRQGPAIIDRTRSFSSQRKSLQFVAFKFLSVSQNDDLRDRGETMVLAPSQINLHGRPMGERLNCIRILQ